MSKIKDFFKNLWLRISRIFKKFMKIAIPKTFEYLIARLNKFAMDIVKSLEGIDLSNDKKREEAFKRIKNRAIVEGIYFENNWIYALINLALSAVREMNK